MSTAAETNIETTDNTLHADVAAAGASIARLREGLNQILLGQGPLIEGLLTGILAGGHVLLEGLPGLGKTELVKGLARLASVEFKRVQFTPDLLPSDVTGSFILQEVDGRREFIFQQGPVFTNLLLGDEINRASPKTQSALLEAMAERAVTVLGETRKLPLPFFVIATQNPIELEGTYPLPEAQVDRFLLKLHVPRPSQQVLSDIARNRIGGAPPTLAPAVSHAELLNMITLAGRVYLAEPVAAYLARLVEASHPDSPLAPPLVKQFVKYGGSPRAALGLAAAGRARALLQGRPQVGFDTIREQFAAVMNHRLILDYTARLEGIDVWRVIEELLTQVTEFSKPLPAGVTA
jgi:MoxR-like ATPase